MEIQFKHGDITFACFFTELLCNKEIKNMVEQKKKTESTIEIETFPTQDVTCHHPRSL